MARKEEDADVIVVGAGIMGTSLAHHLLDRGAGDVVVFDAGHPGGATSGAGAGFVSLWAAGYNPYNTDGDLALQQYGIDFYSRLPDTGALIDHRRDGNLFVATSDEGYKKFIAPMEDHPFAPDGVQALNGDEVNRLSGGAFAADAVAGGVLHPRGIQMSAGRANRALAARITAMGGTIRTHTPVTGLLVSDGKVAGVRTGDGEVRARRVVLANGAWTNELLAEVGFRLPLLRIVATRAITAPSGVSRKMPTVMVPELKGLWLREHRGGFTYGNHDGYAPLFDLGGDAGSPGRPRRDELVSRLQASLADELARMIPDHDTSIAWWLQGLPCMTPDRHFVAGPVPGVEGLHVFAGDNEAGVTHGPGLARMLTEMMLDGGSDWVDTSIYSPDRFKANEFNTEAEIWEALPPRGWAAS